MNENTIAINYDNDPPTISGRELHEALGIKTQYSKWFARMCEYGFSDGQDFFTILEKSTGGRHSTDHAVTIDMAKELCMIQRSEIGKRCREYFIEVEKKWKSHKAVVARALVFANHRLELAKQQNKILTETNLSQEKLIEEMKPKATYHNLVLSAGNAIPITTIAKDYGKSGRWLNSYLHECGVQYKQGEVWLLYQKYADKGYVKSRTYTVNDSDGNTSAKPHTLWKQAGRLFIYELLKADGILPLIEKENNED